MGEPTASDVHVDTVSAKFRVARPAHLDSQVVCPNCGRRYSAATYARCPSCGTDAPGMEVAKFLDEALARAHALDRAAEGVAKSVGGYLTTPDEAATRLALLDSAFGPEIDGWEAEFGERTETAEAVAKHDAATRRALHALARARRKNLRRIAAGKRPIVDGKEVSLEEFNRQHGEHLSAEEAQSRLAKSVVYGCGNCAVEKAAEPLTDVGECECGAKMWEKEIVDADDLSLAAVDPDAWDSAYTITKAREMGRLDLLRPPLREPFLKAFGGSGFASTPGQAFKPDPRLHSHPFVPDPNAPNRCRDCGMGTGVHSRMVYKPPVDEFIDEEPATPATKSADSLAKRARQALARAARVAAFGWDPASTPGSEAPLLGQAVVKADGPKRFTLGPMYLPDHPDAHGEWITADDLQTATWDFVRKTGGDRTIYLQHSEHPAGEWVEIVSWPQEVSTRLIVPSADGHVAKAARDVTLPAGTVYFGIIWEPWAYESVQKGEITGLSMGGMAQRVFASPTNLADSHDLD